MTTCMRFLSLFTGVGGLDLGLERAGWTCVGMCEQDEFCRAVLSSHWPAVPISKDVRELTAHSVPELDAIVGGFPCQDISTAGKGAGIEGERSGLWREFYRLIRDARPRWAIAENVPALRNRGADRVLGDLEGCGYTCTPLVVGARHVGAPHRRDRVFIVAHRDGERERGADDTSISDAWRDSRANTGGRGWGMAHSDSVGFQRERRPTGLGERDTHGRDATQCDVGYAVEFDGRQSLGDDASRQPELQRPSGTVADAGRVGLERRGECGELGRTKDSPCQQADGRDAGGAGARDRGAPFPPGPGNYSGWRRVLESDPDLAPATPVERQICRVADGLPDRVGRRWRKGALRGLGNAVVVDVAEMIGSTILGVDRGLRTLHVDH
ncbi:MAG: DNA cytosine methyltransferase [Planctomycetota bacterium]